MRDIVRKGSCTAWVILGLLGACNPESPLPDEVEGSEANISLVTAPAGSLPCDARAYAITANTGSVIVNSGALVDSYQPSQGPYGGSNIGPNGSVRAATSISNRGVIKGNQVPNSPAHLAVIPVATGALNLPLGSPVPGNLNINTSSDSITLAPGAYVVSNLNVNSPGAINISPQGRVQIWVTGNLNLGGQENPTGLPSNLAFMVNSSGYVNVNSNGQLFGSIYAPTSTVDINSTVYGAVVGSSVTLNSGAAVHFGAAKRAIDAVVNPTLYSQIGPAIETYCQDLENEGYQLLLRTMSATSPASDLRNLLIADYQNYGIEGAFFIGNVPYAQADDSNHPTPYPLDYYFMDLTGTWTDADGDGAFDGHSDPDHGPEIYVGRLRADNMGQPETTLVNSYFQRNHAYRTAGSLLPQAAVALNASPWLRPQRLEALYGAANVDDTTIMTGNQFLNLLGSKSAELYFTITDSSPTTHSFPDRNVTSTEIAGVAKAYHFFLLHACSAGDFTVPNNLAFTYVLVNTQGLAAIGVTKSSSTSHFNDVFASDFMGMDQSLGMALLHFDALYMNDNLPDSGEGEFHIFGDPTLRLNSQAGTLPPPSQPRNFVWNTFNNDYQYTLGSLATYGGYYNIDYFTTLGTSQNWWKSDSRGYGDYNDDVTQTTTANDFALLTFDGSGVEFYTETHPNHGEMDVYVDSVFQQTISLKSTSRQAQQLLYSFQWDRNGRHNIVLVNKNSGEYGMEDYFKVRRDQ
jgi:hypothetical protein